MAVLFHFQKLLKLYRDDTSVRLIGAGNRNTHRKPLTLPYTHTKFITQRCIEYTPLWPGIECIS
jgi:hypothetical protein